MIQADPGTDLGAQQKATEANGDLLEVDENSPLAQQAFAKQQ